MPELLSSSIRVTRDCRYLYSEKDTSIALVMEQESRVWGVTAVPTFVVNRKIAVPGAEDPMVLAKAIEQVLQIETQ